ncbi:Ger(x)C family spore germination protein [Ammoniphilus sp. 3BR4]|uniref:Ger(x)C family spore germination protein n=1 Tax=Ammoniphilus sp. 3BR4 TaxID=3158265 RepID=UPI003467DEA4
MKHMLFVLLLLANSFLLSGCWDRTEVNDLALVVGVGIDKKDKKTVELTVEFSVPKALGGGGGGGGGSAGGGGPQTLVRSGEGNTVADAISDLQEKIPRDVFWGHAKVIVIGEKAAKEGIREHLDFFSRQPQTRLRAHVFVAKGKAKDVMALLPPLEGSSSEVLRELAKSEILADVTLKELFQMLTGDAQAAALPMVSRLPPGEGLEPQQTIAYINRTAIFKKDKMIGQISDKLTRGVLWFRNEIQQATVTVKTEKGKGYISTTLLRANTELIPKIEGGKWKITVKAVTEDDVILNASNLNLMNPEFVKILEKGLQKDLEKRLTLTLNKVQKELKADIFGFSEVFHRKYPMPIKLTALKK